MGMGGPFIEKDNAAGGASIDSEPIRRLSIRVPTREQDRNIRAFLGRYEFEPIERSSETGFRLANQRIDPKDLDIRMLSGASMPVVLVGSKRSIASVRLDSRLADRVEFNVAVTCPIKGGQEQFFWNHGSDEILDQLVVREDRGKEGVMDTFMYYSNSAYRTQEGQRVWEDQIDKLRGTGRVTAFLFLASEIHADFTKGRVVYRVRGN